MTPKEFQEISDKVEAGKETKARAEGARAKILEQFKRDYDIDNLEKAEEMETALSDEIAEDKKKLNNLYSKLEQVTDWEDE